MSDYNNHDELVLISAERYAMGRQTYIVQVVANYIRERVNMLSDWCLIVLKNDYEDKQKEAKRLNSDSVFGMDCDKREWDALYAAVTQELGRRKHAT